MLIRAIIERKEKAVIVTVFILAVSLFAFLSISGIPANAEKKFVLRLGTVVPESHPHTLGAMYFAKLVKERTQGQVEIQVFPNGQLGSNPELLDGVKTGTIDLCVNIPGGMAEYEPVIGFF